MSFVLDKRRARPHVPRAFGGDAGIVSPASGMLSEPVALVETAPVLESSPDSQVRAAEADRLAAIEDARRAGEARGYADGMARARAAINQAIADQKARFDALLGALDAPWLVLQEDLADAIVHAAERIARAASMDMARFDRAALVQAVRTVLDEAERMRDAGHRLTLHVAPGDLDTVSALVADYGVPIVADSGLRVGEVRADLARVGDPSDKITWEATWKTQWQAIQKALGTDAGGPLTPGESN